MGRGKACVSWRRLRQRWGAIFRAQMTGTTISGTTTQTSRFIPPAAHKVCGMGVFRYLGSMHQPNRAEGGSPRRIWHPGLPAQPIGGINLLAERWVGCGLNSRQINHLLRVTSETHYRGHATFRSRTGADAHGGCRIRGPAPGQFFDAPAQRRAQNPCLPHHPQRRSPGQ